MLTIMRTCTKCHIEKEEKDFFVRNKHSGRLHAQCKLCYKDNRQTYYAYHYAKYKDAYLVRAKIRRDRIRAEFHSNMLNYMYDKACEDCGEADIRVLELDHINPKLKSFMISQSVKLGFSWDNVLEEIKKCRVLCANCHKKRTAQQFNWYKAI